MAAPGIGLPQLRYGFHGYKKVTESVTSKLDTGIFQDPAKMARTMPYFAELAFDPMRRYVEGTGSMNDAPWGELYYGENATNYSAWKSMKKFWDDHIYGDLAHALKGTDTQPHHKEDYRHPINTTLSETGWAMIDEYVDIHPWLKKLKLDKIGLHLALRDIYKARDIAWEIFEELDIADTYHSGTLTPEEQLSLLLQHPKLGGRPPRTPEQIHQYLTQRAARGGVLGNKAVGTLVERVCKTPDHLWM